MSEKYPKKKQWNRVGEIGAANCSLKHHLANEKICDMQQSTCDSVRLKGNSS